MIVAAIVVLPAPSGTASPVVPTQWIAKQFSELLGRAPTDAEWEKWVQSFDASARCSSYELAEMGRSLARSRPFADAYPRESTLDRATRFTALIRAALSRDPDAEEWQTLFVPYRDGRDTWVDVVDAVYASSQFTDDVVADACNPQEPGYGFGTARGAGPPLDLRSYADAGASRTQAELQAEIDRVAAAGGGPVELALGEVVRIGGATSEHRPLVIKSGVTLTTANAPTRAQYARMGRIVADGPDAKVCADAACDNVAMVRVEPGGGVTNVWVEGDGFDADVYKVAAIESTGSTDAQPTKILGNRVSAPARDGVGIRARGFSLSGAPCSGEIIADNVVTGYASAQLFDSHGQARWADGIAVGCESTRVMGNDLIDISDTGIVLYGSYNRELATMRAQTSTVTGNRVLSAGLSSHVALGFDAIGECSAYPTGGVVPCLDEIADRDFHGAAISGNTYWTGPRTHFDVGLMVGGGVRWGDHRIFGTGASASDNTTGAASARVNIGVVVLAMHDSSLSNNTGTFELVDGNPLSVWGKCPQVALAVGATELATATIVPSAAAAPAEPADGCLIGEPSPGGLDALKIDAEGHSLVSASSGRQFVAWGMTSDDAIVDTASPEWGHLVADFREVRRMGANIVRLNLQFSDFVGPPTAGYPDGTPDQANLLRIEQVAQLAEQMGLYIELSGLRIERDADNGDWYDTRAEAPRWRSQAVFWTAIASRLKHSSAVAWYDVMNEPSASVKEHPIWCAAAMGGFCYVQFLTKEVAGRTSAEIARAWLTIMRDAIRVGAGDTNHPITVAMLPYGNGGFRPSDIADLEDLVTVHVYPRVGEAEMARAIRDVEVSRSAGRPLILDETGPIGGGDVGDFILQTAPSTAGWLGHYFADTPAETLGDPGRTLADWWHLGFYRTFMRLGPQVDPGDGGVMQP